MRQTRLPACSFLIKRLLRWGGGTCFPVAVLLLFVAPAAWTAPKDTFEPKAQNKAESVSKEKQPERSIRMDEIEILGEVEKPKTMFVIPRAPHHYYWERARKDFTAEILAPINRQDMEDTQRWMDATSLR